MPSWGEICGGALDGAAAHVRERFRIACPDGSLVPLGNRGGFSGARLWRCEGFAGGLCLRAWPAHKAAAWVRDLHRLMESARRQGLDFVPAVYSASDGDTLVEESGRVWELTQWLDGQADFDENPSPTRLDSACEALAKLHRAWEPLTARAEPCPAVRRRLRVLTDWHTLVSSGWRPEAPPDPHLDPLWPLAQRAWRGLPGWLQEVLRYLESWIDFRCPVQPCLCDPWHDNLLFESDRLTGLVDYGTVKNDHVAVDVSRMLGSLVGDDVEGWERGLRAYRRVRELTENEEQLAYVLDRTGTILAVVNWLHLVYYEGRSYEDLSAVVGRLSSLLNRIEGWSLSRMFTSGHGLIRDKEDR